MARWWSSRDSPQDEPTTAAPVSDRAAANGRLRYSGLPKGRCTRRATRISGQLVAIGARMLVVMLVFVAPVVIIALIVVGRNECFGRSS